MANLVLRLNKEEHDFLQTNQLLTPDTHIRLLQLKQKNPSYSLEIDKEQFLSLYDQLSDLDELTASATAKKRVRSILDKLDTASMNDPEYADLFADRESDFEDDEPDFDDDDELDELDELEDLDTDDPVFKQALQTLQDAILHGTDTLDLDEEGRRRADAFLEQFPPEILESMKELLARKRFDNYEEFEAALHEVSDRFESLPQEIFFGLSLRQVGRLVEDEWGYEDSVVQLNDELPLADVRQSPLFNNARLLLSRLAEAPIPAVARGFLNHDFVRHFLEAGDFIPQVRQEYLAAGKNLREEDCPEVNAVHVLLELAELMAPTKKSTSAKGRSAKGGRPKSEFVITDNGRETLLDENAGNLYALLFHYNFREMNLALYDLSADDDLLQAMVPFYLYVIAQKCETWVSVRELLDIFQHHLSLLEDRRDAYLEEHGHSHDEPLPEPPDSAALDQRLLRRVLYPLQEFALVEARIADEAPRRESLFLPEAQLRRTPLFERFLRFQFDASPEA